MSKILAIDFGLKRTGLALSDDSRIFAFGHDTIESKDLMNYLIKLVPKEVINTIVLGEPKRLNNTDTHISENVRLFKEALKLKFSEIEIVSMDERFTSKMASQSISMMGKNKATHQNKGLVDKVSATIILQSYLQSLV
jgi:putative Holliday junction resolvase|tara:strand:+ start:23678 stop:24091 length:414 start_codon:yes stop_codon:yes gene_type:complete